MINLSSGQVGVGRGYEGGDYAVNFNLENDAIPCRSWLASDGGPSVKVRVTGRTPSPASRLLQGICGVMEFK